MMNATRRNTLKLMSAAIVGSSGLTLSKSAMAAGKITVLNWQGYGTDEKWAVAAFKEASGIEVVHDYFSSEAEMLTKLRTNPGAYDLVLLNAARCAQAASEGLVIPIDHSKVPNVSSVAKKLLENPNFNKDGKGYAVPWVWGMTSLAVREGVKADSYAILGDAAYKNRVALSDDAVTMIAVGALLTGQDINDPKDFAKIGDVLKSFKPNVHLLWSSEDQWNKSFAAKEFDVAVYWSGSAIRSKRVSKLPLEFIVPKEGAVGWADGLGIPKGATNADGALAYINWMIDPKFYVEWATIRAVKGKPARSG